ncbi:family 20 glycosylhydrolase [Paenibacillus sp. BC26]|uniref:beta-N-acetylhexosaminidase n=1 Tax=Paenibacillus sp. BC26 TaxID=1881032 RepID=UPI0008F05286|nr:family 20 glycosylhydrolase [Paenibacillus sp. BC26]SFS54457.1 Glycosyl hydrolase family 20, domain 2 [Paenibacillus sp. BC26]
MTCPVYLYPQPRSYTSSGESFPSAAQFELKASGPKAARFAEQTGVKERLEASLQAAASVMEGIAPSVQAVVEVQEGLHPQGYVVEWNVNGLRLASSTAQGLHYALLTAAQMIEGQRGYATWLHCLIEDEPDYPVRGVMLDIGRNKIPKMETLFAFIDLLSGMKINHLQLYTEGFSFNYSKYAELFPGETPMTADEYRELDIYAKARYIDLVPNQNCLGHMGPWLAKPEFRDLAEHPDGLPAPAPLPFKLPPMTLNPLDERSIALVQDMFDALLPNFSSEYVNINMDEPFGLGTGASKERADEIGVGALYLDYAKQVFDIARSHGMKTLMWGDVLAHHPEIVKHLPEDVTVLHWNYDAPVPFEPRCKMLQENGIPFYVCPGTSSWSSISGRTDNMLGNIADAAQTGKTYGAGGFIVADWGDAGHWQALPISYPGFAYAAGASWQTETNIDRLLPFEYHVAMRMLQDRSGGGAKLLLEMGRYYHLERSTMENMTYTSHLMNRGLSDRAKLEREMEIMVDVFRMLGGSGKPFRLDYRYSEMEDWLRARRMELDCLELAGADADILRDELVNTLLLIEQGAGLHKYIYRQALPDVPSEIAWLEQLEEQLELATAEFKRLWLVRNREGGLTASTAAFAKLLNQYSERLQELNNQS